MAGMFLDSGCLYRSTLRAYPSSGCTVCKDVYVIQAVRLIWNAEQISTLCAYIMCWNRHTPYTLYEANLPSRFVEIRFLLDRGLSYLSVTESN